MAAVTRSGRTENLAFIYQEPFTAVVRLRSNRQAVTEAESFRAHMRKLIKNSEETAQVRGYPAEDVRLATFAVVAFLDETVLRLQNPVFGDWPRKPLQEELFGGHVAGEIFFESLQRLLGRGDDTATADILETFYLSLLLGYRGKYGVGGEGDLRGLMQRIDEKIRRIRKPDSRLSPSAAPPDALGGAGRDPWIKWLTVGAATCLVAAVLVFIGFRVSLGSGVSELHTMVVDDRGAMAQ